MLCHQFMQLIREHSTCEHQVPFYTEQLCITPRYLYEITTQYMNGKTPKQLIDEQLIAEAKVLLNEPCLSVTEIAELLNFADQSYLSRFSKRTPACLLKNSGYKSYYNQFRQNNLKSVVLTAILLTLLA